MTNRSKHVLTAALAAAAIAAAPHAYAQQTSEQRIQDLVRHAAERVQAASQSGSTTAAATPAQSGASSGAAMNLSLDDAVKMALDHNLDIAVQRLNPQINDVAIASAESVYAINLGSTVQQSTSNNPSQQTISGAAAGTAINQGTLTYNGTVSKAMQFGGGNFLATLNNNRQTTSSLTTFYNPAYNTNWSLQYTQPLLRNFRIDANRENIYVARVNRDISDTQLQSTITNTVSNVRNAYWDFVYAQQSVQVAQQNLDLSLRLVKDNQTRVEVGTMAPLDVYTAESQAANNQQALVAAQSNTRTAELALKRLIVAGTDDPMWKASLTAVDTPDFTPQPVDIDAAIRRALAQRTDLQIIKKDVQMNDVILKYLKDQTRPQADLAVRYGAIGQGGTQYETQGTGITRTITGTIPGGYTDALNSLFRDRYPAWSVGLTVNYPLGLSAQEASVARAQVQLNQIGAQLKQSELQVANDVTSAAINVQNTAQSVDAANQSVELAQKQLDAEQSKLEVGMSTNYNVVLAQNNYASAKSSQLSALRNYRKALVELDRVQQTTLSSAGITILGR